MFFPTRQGFYFDIIVPPGRVFITIYLQGNRLGVRCLRSTIVSGRFRDKSCRYNLPSPYLPVRAPVFNSLFLVATLLKYRVGRSGQNKKKILENKRTKDISSESQVQNIMLRYMKYVGVYRIVIKVSAKIIGTPFFFFFKQNVYHTEIRENEGRSVGTK